MGYDETESSEEDLNSERRQGYSRAILNVFGLKKSEYQFINPNIFGVGLRGRFAVY